ncbi:GSCOCG00011218001-RA-CDS, partial [Cotesia congregata]
GRLRYFINNWKQITTDKVVLDYINGYKIPLTQTPTQKISPKERNLSVEETEKIQVEIDKLIIKGAIERCEECDDQFISPYFLVPKPDGTNRFIFNLKELNEFIDPPHFNLEDIRSALGLISPGDYLGSMDFQDAYLIVPIYPGHRKFLRFRF